MKQETKQETRKKKTKKNNNEKTNNKLFLIERFYQNVKRKTCYFKLEMKYLLTLLETVPTPP